MDIAYSASIATMGCLKKNIISDTVVIPSRGLIRMVSILAVTTRIIGIVSAELGIMILIAVTNAAVRCLR